MMAAAEAVVELIWRLWEATSSPRGDRVDRVDHDGVRDTLHIKQSQKMVVNGEVELRFTL